MSLEIKEGLFALLQDDATLLALQGGTAADTRVHGYREPDISEFTISVKTLATVFQIPSGGGITNMEGNAQRPNEMYQVDVWGVDPDAVEQTSDRIYAVLHESAIPDQGSTQAFRIEEVAAGDMPEGSSGSKATMYHKTLRYLITSVYKSG